MRSAHPLELHVRRFGVWRAGVSVLAACTCAALVAWWGLHSSPVPPWASLAVAAGLVLTCACATALWRRPALTLRWDGQCWHLAEAEPGWPAGERAGELAVALDLGLWMLLRFVPEAAGASGWRNRRPAWLPVQRAGMTAQWHALRCALYGARQAAPPAGAQRSGAHSA